MGRTMQIGGVDPEGILRVGWEGKEVTLAYQHEILIVPQNAKWIRSSKGRVPSNALMAGCDAEGRVSLQNAALDHTSSCFLLT
jgi:hypothetical protein